MRKTGEIPPREFKYNPCVMCPNKAGSWSSKILPVLQCPLLFLTSLVMGQIFALRTEWPDLPEGKTVVLWQFKSAALQISPLGLGTWNSQENIVTWVKFQLSLAYYLIYFLNNDALSISGLESSLHDQSLSCWDMRTVSFSNLVHSEGLNSTHFPGQLVDLQATMSKESSLA